MTSQEHAFMLSMYAMQSSKFNILVEILKTRGVLDDDDLQAFQAHVAEETQDPHEWFLKAWESYQLAARNLGVTTGLENWQPPQKKA